MPLSWRDAQLVVDVGEAGSGAVTVAPCVRSCQGELERGTLDVTLAHRIICGT